ncbi:outer membrane beta-barrel protein [Hymenobacter sp. H14-R3]|uniref:outer membrane beta-barrel protein n=1 Tax=Hymenobacter sp. H14-R3 TaxID=3046308 RepID=UPI0024BA8AD3|nr:outer membrane beta-barrel protein [Hymenobacter sp. H14-R3]MDJ0363787.1 outer membrane beta-barrel protein [Hymenobacter sp. H14-R3]
MNPSTPPKGSLEDLFRHHLLESEAAAVPPRPQVWEHLDNRLLLAQNEKYRHRLAAYRWAVAASLLLASLAGGGWWHSQQQAAPTAATLAVATPAAAGRPGLATAQRAATTTQLTTSAPLGAASQATVAVTSPSLSPASPIDQTTTLSASRPTQPTATAAYTQALNHWQTTQAQPATARTADELTAISTRNRLAAARNQVAAQFSTQEQAAGQTQEMPAALGLSTRGLANATPGRAGVGNGAAITNRTPADELAADALPASALASAVPTGEGSLATHWASLAALPLAGRPTDVATVAVAAGPPLELARNWQYGVSYAASAFQPNIDFSKAADSYNTAFGLNSPIITRSAAAEYRNNLRAGLGQRLSVWATRRLGASRWGLRTGLEFTQSSASSASSVAFVGEQVADLSYSQAVFAPKPAARLQSTSYRYRSVSVPVEARYSNPTKSGFSFYGRMGAFVTALLNVRSEVEDNPEAARTYTPTSVSSPYRHLSVGLRGGGGVQYRPTGHQWALNLGPVAEMGVLSLNANANQDFLKQQRPYSFGLEAGVELGRGFKIQ